MKARTVDNDSSLFCIFAACLDRLPLEGAVAKRRHDLHDVSFLNGFAERLGGRHHVSEGAS